MCEQERQHRTHAHSHKKIIIFDIVFNLIENII